MIDEPEGMNTFRIGLFGIDKVRDIAGTVGKLETALDIVMKE
jgi:aspartate aminotransferase-like enzyme